MARRLKLRGVALELQQQLLQNHLENPALTIDDHAAWLGEQGIPVSRSAVHRFLQAAANEARASSPLLPEQELRLRCLEAAATIYNGESPNDLTALASTLADWVRSGS